MDWKFIICGSSMMNYFIDRKNLYETTLSALQILYRHYFINFNAKGLSTFATFVKKHFWTALLTFKQP